MKKELDAIAAMVKPETLTDRKKVLEVITQWTIFKGELLNEVKKRPMTTFAQREEVSDTMDRIKILNIWPWGGALESILEHVGQVKILEHWTACLSFARAELAKLETKAA
jgi:hypothetical protein